MTTAQLQASLPASLALLLAACARGPAPSPLTTATPTPSASVAASASVSASNSAEIDARGFDLLGFGGIAPADWDPNCKPLDQFLGRPCLEKLGQRFQRIPLEPREPLALPHCVGGPTRVQVRLTPGPERGSLGCGDEFDLTISGQSTRLAVCQSACGPAGFHAEVLPERTRVAFSCWADLQNVEGVISLEAGALVVRRWDTAVSNRLLMTRQTYALPCNADVHFKVTPWSNVP